MNQLTSKHKRVQIKKKMLEPDIQCELGGNAKLTFSEQEQANSIQDERHEKISS